MPTVDSSVNAIGELLYILHFRLPQLESLMLQNGSVCIEIERVVEAAEKECQIFL